MHENARLRSNLFRTGRVFWKKIRLFLFWKFDADVLPIDKQYYTCDFFHVINSQRHELHRVVKPFGQSVEKNNIGGLKIVIKYTKSGSSDVLAIK